ncbi:hypothetical protein Tco_0671171 [Tanacetum coccineum]
MKDNCDYMTQNRAQTKRGMRAMASTDNVGDECRDGVQCLQIEDIFFVLYCGCGLYCGEDDYKRMYTVERIGHVESIRFIGRCDNVIDFSVIFRLWSTCGVGGGRCTNKGRVSRGRFWVMEWLGARDDEEVAHLTARDHVDAGHHVESRILSGRDCGFLDIDIEDDYSGGRDMGDGHMFCGRKNTITTVYRRETLRYYLTFSGVWCRQRYASCLEANRVTLVRTQIGTCDSSEDSMVKSGFSTMSRLGERMAGGIVRWRIYRCHARADLGGTAGRWVGVVGDSRLDELDVVVHDHLRLLRDVEDTSHMEMHRRV